MCISGVLRRFFVSVTILYTTFNGTSIEIVKKYTFERRKSGLAGRFRDRMEWYYCKMNENTLFFVENGLKLIVLMQKYAGIYGFEDVLKR